MAYAFTGEKFGGSSVSYYINPAYGYETGIREAFAAWDAVIALDFYEVSTAAAADITITFAPQDGPGGALGQAAWSFGAGGIINSATITFDSGEAWATKSGTTLYQTALHEIGHTIGLDHPNDPTSIMNAIIRPSVTQLSADDITGARLIYGAETDTAPVADTPTYVYGWSYVYNFGWELGWTTGWSIGWYVGWSYGWTVGWSTGWQYGWIQSWGYELSGNWQLTSGWNWVLGWDYGWNIDATGGWQYTYDYGWHVTQSSAWEYVTGWELTYGWDYGWVFGWTYGWTVDLTYGWNYGWNYGWIYGWTQAWGWHYTPGWILV